MPKMKIKKIRTIRKKVQVAHSKNRGGKHGVNDAPQTYHFDGSPCCFYCHCILYKEGYGKTTLYYTQDEKIHGNYDGILQALHLLLNSKSFLEFLCALRHYVFLSNSSKRCYFTLVLCAVFRDIVMESKYLPSQFNCNRFISYCLKWIPELRTSNVTCESFIQLYMSHIESELHDMNKYAYKIWCGHSLSFLLSDSTQYFIPLSNPLESKLKESENDVIQTKSAFILSIPTELQYYQIINPLSLQWSKNQFSIPHRNIQYALQHDCSSIIQYGFTLIIKCEPLEVPSLIPPYITLQGIHKNGDVGSYSIRTVITMSNSHMIIYNHLFPVVYNPRRHQKMYDVHTMGKWIQLENTNCSLVEWRVVEKQNPLFLVYEYVFH